MNDLVYGAFYCSVNGLRHIYDPLLYITDAFLKKRDIDYIFTKYTLPWNYFIMLNIAYFLLQQILNWEGIFYFNVLYSQVLCQLSGSKDGVDCRV